MEYRINKFIELKLEIGKTVIYIDKKPFTQCKGVFIEIPVESDSLDIGTLSMDELSEKYKQQITHNISPETIFWAHCSNMQVWVEHGYDTSLLHSNIAFPLLKRLIQVGDIKAKQIFKEEIGKRFASGHLPTIQYLEEVNLLELLSEEERNIIFKEMKKKLLADKDVEQVLKVLVYLEEIGFPQAIGTIRHLIKKGVRNNDKLYSKLLSSEYYTQYFDNLDIYDCLIDGDTLAGLNHYVIGDLELQAEFNPENGSGFSIEGNQITGIILWGYLPDTFPEEILGLKSLKNLDISSETLHSLPENIDKMKSLERLILERNHLTTLTSAIGNLPSLKVLNLDVNKLSILPNSIRNLKNLEVLSIMSNDIIKLPKGIGDLKSLKILNLSSNELTELPDSIENLNNLQELNLNGNKFSIFPEVITRLKSLKKLDMEHNNLDILPESIGNLKSLNELVLGNNKFEVLPNSIGKLNLLKVFSISYSELKKLPRSIGNLESLEKFFLSEHKIESLPKSINNLKSLKELNVRSNRIKNSQILFSSLKDLKSKKIKIYK